MFSTTPSLGRSNSTKYCTHFVQKVCSTLLDAKSLDWDHEGSKQQPPPPPPPPPAPPGGMVDYKDISRSPPGMSKPLFIVNDWINRQAQLAIYLYLYLYFYVYICIYIYYIQLDFFLWRNQHLDMNFKRFMLIRCVALCTNCVALTSSLCQLLKGVSWG